MSRRVWIVLLCVLSSLFISACGATPAMSSPEATVIEALAAADAPAIAQQMITALAQQDTVTVERLTDTEMPMRDLTLAGELQQWKDRTYLPQTYYYSAIGPLMRTTLQPPEQRGATTVIKAVLTHQLGEAEIELSLRETSVGWRVVGLNSRVTDHPVPTPKP